MNRRSFLTALGKAVAGFSILPPATTYGRVWRATVKLDTEYNCVMTPHPHGYYLSQDLWMLTDRETKEMFEKVMVSYWKQRAPELQCS